MWRSYGFACSLNAECSNGTDASESIVTAMELYPDGSLAPGQMIPEGSTIGLTWSGCWPNGTVVPNVTGQPWSSSWHVIHNAGLTINCVSAAPYNAATNAEPMSVISQSPAPGTTVAGGTTETLTTQVCAADIPNNSGNSGNSGNS